jgi:hypothetical protein
MTNGKPKRRPDESKKDFKRRKKEYKKEQKLVKKYEKAGITDPAFLAQKKGSAPPPPPSPHERPIPTTKTREEGGQREDGSYVRRSTVNIDKIEAHLDTMSEKDRSESLQDRFKSEYGEDLDVPEGYELIPDRDVHKRVTPPSVAQIEGRGLSAETLALAYGTDEPPVVPAEVPAPAPLPEPVLEPEPEPEPAPEPEPEPEPAPEPEPEPEPVPEPEAPASEEGEPEVPEEETDEEAPEPEPASVPTTPVAGAVAGSVAGVAGVAGASEAKEGEAAEAKVEDDFPPAKRPFLHLARFVKLGRRPWATGGPIVKLILGLINFFLYIGLLLFLLLPVWATIYYFIKDYKAKKAEEEKYWEEHPEELEHAQDGYGYGEEQGYPPEGEYYEGEGYYDDESSSY